MHNILETIRQTYAQFQWEVYSMRSIEKRCLQWPCVTLKGHFIYCTPLPQRCVRAQRFRGQGQRSSRPRPKISRPRLRPVIFVMKDSQVWVTQRVWNPQVDGSNNRGYLCVNAWIKLGTVCNFIQTCGCAKAWK